MPKKQFDLHPSLSTYVLITTPKIKYICSTDSKQLIYLQRATSSYGFISTDVNLDLSG